MRHWFLVGWTTVAVLGGVHSVAAQGAQTSIDLNRFRAAPMVEDAFAISRADDLGHMRFGAQLHLDYSNDPLVWETQLGERSTETASIVGHQLTGNVALSLGLADLLAFYVGLPVHFLMTGDDPPPNSLAAADGSSLGDAYLGVRARLYGKRYDSFALAGQFTVTVPTGMGFYGGDEKLTGHLQLIPELRLGLLRLTMNAGVRFRESTRLAGVVDLGSELTFGFGVTAPLYGTYRNPSESRLDLVAQVYGASSFEDFFGREESWVEALAGLRYHHPFGLAHGLAIGSGATRGVGSPDVRVIVQVGYTPPPAGPPEEPEEEEPDQDGDGIADSVDECPAEAEDMDGFEDENGCPDPDNDGDTIPDATDGCPDEAEDPDDFQDDDGCPDADNDGDGVLDADDPCMMEAEDVDGFRDDDGCPDIDNDLDDVADTEDRCPLEAGTIGNHGCPDTDRDGDGVVDRLDNCPDQPGTAANQGCRAPQRVRITESRLEILDRVYFATNRARIRSRSHPLLRNVAQVINAHPEIGTVRIEGHTDSTGDAARNRELSQQRADAVKTFLVERGSVDETRLVAVGFGPDRPVDSNETDEGRAANRRVEFNLTHDDPAAGGQAGDEGESEAAPAPSQEFGE